MGLVMKGRRKSPRGSSFKLMLTVEQKARMRRKSITRLLKVEMNKGMVNKKLKAIKKEAKMFKVTKEDAKMYKETKEGVKMFKVAMEDAKMFKVAKVDAKMFKV